MKRALVIALGIVCAGAVRAQSGQPLITRSVMAGGGATVSSGSRFQASSTLGQPNVSVISGNRFSIRQGFWIWRAPVMFATSRVGANIVFSLQTELGKTYSVQYSDSFSNPSWQNVSIITGNGSVQTVTNAAPAGTQRYYRLFEQ